VWAERRDSNVTMFGTTPQFSGGIPISANYQNGRRESMAGSLMTGMSWDGISMGSLRKDSEYVEET